MKKRLSYKQKYELLSTGVIFAIETAVMTPLVITILEKIFN